MAGQQIRAFRTSKGVYVRNPNGTVLDAGGNPELVARLFPALMRRKWPVFF